MSFLQGLALLSQGQCWGTGGGVESVGQWVGLKAVCGTVAAGAGQACLSEDSCSLLGSKFLNVPKTRGCVWPVPCLALGSWEVCRSQQEPSAPLCSHG